MKTQETLQSIVAFTNITQSLEIKTLQTGHNWP